MDLFTKCTVKVTFLKGNLTFGFQYQIFFYIRWEPITIVFLASFSNMKMFKKYKHEGFARNMGQNWLLKPKLQISFEKKLPFRVLFEKIFNISIKHTVNWVRKIVLNAKCTILLIGCVSRIHIIFFILDKMMCFF